MKTAHARELTATVPLSSIADVASETHRSFPFVRVVDLDVIFDDGNQLSVEIGTPATKDGERFAAALASAARKAG